MTSQFLFYTDSFKLITGPVIVSCARPQSTLPLEFPHHALSLRYEDMSINVVSTDLRQCLVVFHWLQFRAHGSKKVNIQLDSKKRRHTSFGAKRQALPSLYYISVFVRLESPLTVSVIIPRSPLVLFVASPFLI